MILPRKQIWLWVAVAILALGSSRAAAGEPDPADGRVASCLDLLHAGRFLEADAQAHTVTERDRNDPAAAFLYAFVAWWRLLYDDKNEALERTLEERLNVAKATAEAAGPGRSAGVDHRVWNGYSRILLAQVNASRREILAAARTAKEGRRLLADALAAEPDSPEPCFGLGTYNYYADRMSALAKSLRFLMGLPSGDRVTGLKQLRIAADGSSLVALESRLLLATIHASRHERDYAAALIDMTRALEQSGGALVVQDAAARLELVLGQSKRAATRLDEALQRASAAPPADPSVIEALTLQRARADFAAFRPDLALERTAPLLDPKNSVPERVRTEARALAASCSLLVGAARESTSTTAKRGAAAPGLTADLWSKLRGALELERGSGPEASLESLGKLSFELPSNPAVALLFGRALLGAGRPNEALGPLERSTRAQDLPRPWLGPALLLAGQAADLAGARERALKHYREATKAPPYVESAAAYYFQRTPFRPPTATVPLPAPRKG